MKNLLLLILMVFSTVLYGQSEPITSLQGQNGTKFTSPKLVVPHSQATKTPLGGLIETGNNNLLANPSFEHQIVGTGWTAVNGSCSSSSGVTVDGLKNCLFTSSGTNWSLSQCSTTNAPRLAGQEMENSVFLGSASSSDPIWVCPGVNGTYPTPSVANGCMQYTNIGNIQRVKNYFLGDSASTSNCIIISGSNSGTTVGIDKAYTGLRTNSEVSGEINTPWIAYTPTLTNMTSSGSNYCNYRRSGPNLFLKCTLVITGASAAEARLGFPNSLITASSARPLEVVGSHYRSQNSPDKGGAVFAEPGKGYITFGPVETYGGGTGISTQKVNASSAYVNGNTVLIIAGPIPIAEWANNINAFSTKCDDPRQCETVFSALISPTGTVSGENTDWLNGNCTTTTGAQNFSTTCTYNTGIFTVAPNCIPSLKKEFPWTGGVQAVNNNSASYTVSNNGSGAAGIHVYLTCYKTGADYDNSRITQQIVQMRGVPTVTGSVSSSIGSSKYYGASLGTACSALPCQNLKPIGQMISSVGWTGSVYRVTLDKTYKKASCSINAVIFGTGYTATETYGENVSQLDFSTAYGTAPGVQSSGTVNCIGEY